MSCSKSYKIREKKVILEYLLKKIYFELPMLKIVVFLFLIDCIRTYQLVESSIQLCSLCECYNKKRVVECFNDRWMEFFNDEQVNFTLEAANFRSVQENLKWLRIDMGDLYNSHTSVALDRQLFANMHNLEDLVLIKISNLVELPSLDAVLKLKKLIVHKSNLKRLDGKFCETKPNLVELNLAYNQLEDLSHVLDKCKHLSLLDVSYNRIKSLDNVFGSNMDLARV